MSLLTRATALAGAAGIFVAVLVYKGLFWRNLMTDAWVEVYGLTVLLYIFSRFGISLCYRPSRDHQHEPSVAVVVPAFNEGTRSPSRCSRCSPSTTTRICTTSS